MSTDDPDQVGHNERVDERPSESSGRFDPWLEKRRARRLPLPTLTSAGNDPVLMRIIAYYGPTAFGLVCFLAIWFAAVRPTLEANRVDYHANQAVVDTLRQTVQALSGVVERLERIERRLTP